MFLLVFSGCDRSDRAEGYTPSIVQKLKQSMVMLFPGKL